MQLVYALEEAPDTYAKSLFLVGPSPRGEDTDNWRSDALQLLEEAGYDGVVYIPLPRNGEWSKNYDNQIVWERKNLDRADVLLFWVPRDMQRLPGLTTNIEFGTWYNTGRTVLGYPLDAPHTRYLGSVSRDEGIPLSHSLKETVQNSLKMIGDGAARSGGERDVPLIVWKKPEFQQWYKAQLAAGNRLDGAKIVWNFRVGPMKSFLFFFAVHANVYIAAENRNKTNEVVLFRNDISVIVGYLPANTYTRKDTVSDLDTQIVLIKEFRSPANTSDGYVHELPGGSSWKPGTDPLETAAHEFEEETGLQIDASRFAYFISRQIASTLLAHKAHVYAVLLTKEELATLKAMADAGTHHGVEEDTERTYIEVTTIREMLSNPDIDWAMLGMAMQIAVET